MLPLGVAMAINYLHPFPGHRYAYNGCTDRIRKISASVSADREPRTESKYVNYRGPVSVQITNEIFACRKKSPRNFERARRAVAADASKAPVVGNFGETIRLTGLARLCSFPEGATAPNEYIRLRRLPCREFLGGGNIVCRWLFRNLQVIKVILLVSLDARRSLPVEMILNQFFFFCFFFFFFIWIASRNHETPGTK